MVQHKMDTKEEDYCNLRMKPLLKQGLFSIMEFGLDRSIRL